MDKLCLIIADILNKTIGNLPYTGRDTKRQPSKIRFRSEEKRGKQGWACDAV
jgi:hypothetical protein